MGRKESKSNKIRGAHLQCVNNYYEKFEQKRMKTDGVTDYKTQTPPKPWADPEGGGTGGPDPPLKNHKNIGFLCNTGLDPLKNHKATKPAFNVGPSSARQRNIVSMAFR